MAISNTKKKQSIYRSIGRAFLMIFVLMATFLLCDCRPVMADLYNGTATYEYDEAHNVIMKYASGGRMNGTNQYRVRGDFSKMDKVVIPHKITIERCCDNPAFASVRGSIGLIIDGREIYRCNEYGLAGTQSNVCGDTWVNIKNQLTSNSEAILDLLCINPICTHCGREAHDYLDFKGIWFIDERGSATFSQSSYQSQVGGNVEIGASFNAATARYEWAIRKSGESGFTRVTDGSLQNGILVNGASSSTLRLSNLPYSLDGFDVGLFVYDDNGGLPGGYDYPNTPYYVHVSVLDNIPPSASVNKTIKEGTGEVTVTVLASDDGGLSPMPYSWDGGNTFGTEQSKDFSEPGTYKVVVRDTVGNTKAVDFYIDAIEIDRAKPFTKGGEKEDLVGDPDTGKGNGKADGIENPNNKTEDGKNKESGAAAGKPNDVLIENGTFSNVKNNRDDFINGVRVPSSETKDEQNKPKTDVTALGKGSTLGTSIKTGGGKDGLKATSISDEDAQELFEKIKENSKEYVVSMREAKSAKNNDEAVTPSSVNMNENTQINDGEMVIEEDDSNQMDYAPKAKKKASVMFYIVVIGLGILLLLIVLFVLFFGVVIFAEKETELSALNESDGIKIPVALSIVTYSDGLFAICFRELLDKYDLLYARPGALFVYMFENEKIRIMTKFKGDKKHEIAKESIHKEIIVGNGKGRKV